MADANASYINGNPAIALAGSIPPGQAIEYPQREIINALTAAGLIPTNDDLTQLTLAIKLLGRIPFVNDQGSVNALVINPGPAITAYAQPLIFAILVKYTNTLPVTVNVSGLGPIAIIRTTGAALQPGDIVAGGFIIVGYDGARFQLLTMPASLAYPGATYLWHYGVDVSATVNSVVCTADATTVTAWQTGLPIAVKIANTNNAASTITLNGMSAVPIKRGSGAALQPGDLAAGYIALMIYDGAECQLINPQVAYGSVGSGDTIVDPLDPYYVAVKTLTVEDPPASPAMGDLYLIPPGASGGWAGLSGRLAQYSADGWVYRSYPSSSIVSTSDSMRYYQNVGTNSWKEVAILPLGKHFFYAQL